MPPLPICTSSVHRTATAPPTVAPPSAATPGTPVRLLPGCPSTLALHSAPPCCAPSAAPRRRVPCPAAPPQPRSLPPRHRQSYRDRGGAVDPCAVDRGQPHEAHHRGRSCLRRPADTTATRCPARTAGRAPLDVFAEEMKSSVGSFPADPDACRW